MRCFRKIVSLITCLSFLTEQVAFATSRHQVPNIGDDFERSSPSLPISSSSYSQRSNNVSSSSYALPSAQDELLEDITESTPECLREDLATLRQEVINATGAEEDVALTMWLQLKNQLNQLSDDTSPKLKQDKEQLLRYLEELKESSHLAPEELLYWSGNTPINSSLYATADPNHEGFSRVRFLSEEIDIFIKAARQRETVSGADDQILLAKAISNLTSLQNYYKNFIARFCSLDATARSEMLQSPRVKVSGANVGHFLVNQEKARKIFSKKIDKNNEVNRQEGGQNTVPGIGGIHFKSWTSSDDPDPAMEWAMYAFSRVLWSGNYPILPPSDFFAFRGIEYWITNSHDATHATARTEPSQRVTIGQYSHASPGHVREVKKELHNGIVQASLTSGDYSLFQVLTGSNTNLRPETLNPESFGALFTHSLITLPTDLKDDNVRVHKDGRFVAIDNDKSLRDMIIKKNKKHYVEGKNVLYLLKLMDDPLHKSIRKYLKKVDPLKTINSWLELLEERNKEYKLLFEEGCINGNDYTICFPLQLRPNTALTMFKRLCLIQKILKDSEAIVTPHNLLKAIYPIAGLYYEELRHNLREYPHSVQHFIVWRQLGDLKKEKEGKTDKEQEYLQAYSEDGSIEKVLEVRLTRDQDLKRKLEKENATEAGPGEEKVRRTESIEEVKSSFLSKPNEISIEDDEKEDIDENTVTTLQDNDSDLDEEVDEEDDSPDSSRSLLTNSQEDRENLSTTLGIFHPARLSLKKVLIAVFFITLFCSGLGGYLYYLHNSSSTGGRNGPSNHNNTSATPSASTSLQATPTTYTPSYQTTVWPQHTTPSQPKVEPISPSPEQPEKPVTNTTTSAQGQSNTCTPSSPQSVTTSITPSPIETVVVVDVNPPIPSVGVVGHSNSPQPTTLSPSTTTSTQTGRETSSPSPQSTIPNPPKITKIPEVTNSSEATPLKTKSQLEQARKLYEAKNYSASIECLLSMVKSNKEEKKDWLYDIDYLLAKNYLGIQNFEEAKKSAERAADNGHKEAKALLPEIHYSLAEKYHKDKELEKALPLVTDAAQSGNEKAKVLLPTIQLQLAIKFARAEDYENALHYYKMAAQNGQVEAKEKIPNVHYTLLGKYFKERNHGKTLDLLVQENLDPTQETYRSIIQGALMSETANKEGFENAIKWYELASKNGQIQASGMLSILRSMLGDMYSNERAYEEAIKYYQACGERNKLSQTQLQLGKQYYGKGDFEKAVEEFTKAEQYGNLKAKEELPKAKFQLGIKYKEEKKFKEAEELFTNVITISETVPVSDNIVAEAHFELGWIKFHGKNNSTPNISEAKQRFELALTKNKNHIEALVHLGLIHSHKVEDTIENGKKAADLLREVVILSNGKHVGALFELGWINYHGKETAGIPNFNIAEQCFKQSIEEAIKQNSDHANAHLHLGLLYVHPSNKKTQNRNEAVNQFRHIIALNDRRPDLVDNDILNDARFKLGEINFHGIKVGEPNFAAARDRFKDIGETNKNYTNACYHLGLVYRNGGPGVFKDLKEAKAWYTKAAEKGHIESQFELGHMAYEAKDYSGAFKIFDMLSSKVGHIGATYHLGVMHYHGYALPKIDLPNAFKNFKLVVDKGDPGGGASYHLGLMYKRGPDFGQGKTPNLLEAKKWFNQAKQKGHPRAQEKLSEVEAALKIKPPTAKAAKK